MKKAFTYLVVFLLLLTTSSKSALYFNYLAQKSYIAAFLCENRNKPLLDCGGKCYLNKLVVDSEEKSETMNIKIEVEEGYVAELIPDDENIYRPVLPDNRDLFSYNYPPLSGFLNRILHPPASPFC